MHSSGEHFVLACSLKIIFALAKIIGCNLLYLMLSYYIDFRSVCSREATKTFNFVVFFVSEI
jgi:hypothetical protein